MHIAHPYNTCMHVHCTPVLCAVFLRVYYAYLLKLNKKTDLRFWRMQTNYPELKYPEDDIGLKVHIVYLSSLYTFVIIIS